MMSVLGIDAAWTASQPSGIALVVQRTRGWELVAAEPSAGHFLEEGSQSKGAAIRPSGSPIMAKELLAKAQHLSSRDVDLIAVDMPLARRPITRRRACDNAVSRAFGGLGCGTHTPNAVCPGPVGERLQQEFLGAGYPLATASPDRRSLIEVYPHPALLMLTGAERRLPYKFSRIGKYWRELNRSERRERLLKEWASILAALNEQIAGTAEILQLPAMDAPSYALKAFEDALDAVICAWVASAYSRGGPSLMVMRNRQSGFPLGWGRVLLQLSTPWRLRADQARL